MIGAGAWWVVRFLGTIFFARIAAEGFTIAFQASMPPAVRLHRLRSHRRPRRRALGHLTPPRQAAKGVIRSLPPPMVARHGVWYLPRPANKTAESQAAASHRGR